MYKVDHKDYERYGNDKRKQKDQVPKKLRRRAPANYVVKQALAAQRDSSSDLDKTQQPEDVLMMVIEDVEDMFDSFFAFMAKPNDDRDVEVILF